MRLQSWRNKGRHRFWSVGRLPRQHGCNYHVREALQISALEVVESLQCNHQLIFHGSIDPLLACAGLVLSLCSQVWGAERHVPSCSLCKMGPVNHGLES